MQADRRWQCLLTGLLFLVLLVYPVFVAGGLAHSAFSGCWLTCGGRPDTASGVVWVTAAALLLAMPIAWGMIEARVRSWTAWAAAALLIALAVSAWVLFSLDPDNAAFFVELGE